MLRPEHNVTLTQGFYLGKYEVTQAQYEAVMTGNTDGLSATPSNWPNNPDRPVEKVSWDDIQIFLTRLNARRQAISLRVGRMYCPRKRSGSMPAGQARPRRTRGGIDYLEQCELLKSGYSQTVMWAYTVPTLGAFLICMAMCGSGRRTGTQHTVREHRPILRVRLRAPPCLSGRFLVHTGTTCVRLRRYNSPATARHIGFRVGFQQITKHRPISTPRLRYHCREPTVGTIVGEFNATDPDGGAITYHFVNGDNNNSSSPSNQRHPQNRHHF